MQFLIFYLGSLNVLYSYRLSALLLFSSSFFRTAQGRRKTLDRDHGVQHAIPAQEVMPNSRRHMDGYDGTKYVSQFYTAALQFLGNLQITVIGYGNVMPKMEIGLCRALASIQPRKGVATIKK